MDYDDEIEMTKENELVLFLGKELEPLRRTKRVNVYDLEKEYAKTLNNKLWSVWITLGATFLVVLLVTIFTMMGVSASNEKIDANISSFEDLGAQNLLDQISRVREKLDDATKRRDKLQANIDARLAFARLKMEGDLQVLQAATRLSSASINERREQVQAVYDAEIMAAHEEFDEPLATANDEIRRYEEQLKSYNGEDMKRVKNLEKQIDSERLVHQMEKQRIIDSYEAQLAAAKKNLDDTQQKELEGRRLASSEIIRLYEEEILRDYDPIIMDSKTRNIISDVGNKGPAGNYNAERLIDSGIKFSESFADALRQAQQDYEDITHLYDHSSSMPHRNTMKSVVSTERKLSSDITNDLAQAALEEINSKNMEIAALVQQLTATENQRDFVSNVNQYYVDILNSDLFDSKTAGFVIDVERPVGVSVFVRNAFLETLTFDGETRVDIFNGNSKVASGTIFGDEKEYYIMLDSEVDKERISSGNVFRISTKK